jgi:phosphonate transport system permease protein
VLKFSLKILAVTFAFVFLADIEITTLDPWVELTRMIRGALSPDLPILWDYHQAILNTLVFATCGLTLGLLIGAPLSLIFHYRVIRTGCALIRAVHEIFWAFLFLPMVGLNPICGVLAIAIPYSGVFAKVFAEIMEEADRQPVRALPDRSDLISRFAYGVLPVVLRSARSYSAYRFECALRSSAVLGFIGLPTLGFHLETAFREGLYSEAAAILYAFYFLIFSLRWWLRPRIVGIGIVAAFALLAKEITFRWENVSRFAVEILPWPIRRSGFLDGSGELDWTTSGTATWLLDILGNQALTGAWDTVILTQIALGVTGVFAALAFPLVCRHFADRPARGLGKLALIVGRTTPEYVLAYIFIQLWGPSMLPAILAISIHNGAILAHLTGARADQITLRPDASRRNIDRYGYEILPRTFGQLLAFLFYRWEIIARESAILGILGIYTIGFFIDSAISDDKLDQAIVLIAISAIINVGIDLLSQRIRRNLRISLGEITTVQ